jgi:hypothetical protein
VSRDDLLAMLDQATATPAPAPVAVSVPADSPRYTRSEGLGVASFRAFMAGAFSSDKAQPCRVDAAALRQIDAAALRAIFQSSPSNPLVGLEGRAGLLQRLGDALAAEAARDGLPARPALLYDRMTAGGTATEVSASDVLLHLLQAMGPIWTSGSMVMGVRAGDVWEHRWAGATGDGEDTVTTRLGAVPQAQPVAGLFAARAAAVGRRHRHRAGRADRPARIPQRRPADRQRRDRAAQRHCWSGAGSRPTSSSSNGAR